MAIAPYQNSIEHIFEELNRLALFVKRQIYKFRMAGNWGGKANSDLAVFILTTLKLTNCWHNQFILIAIN